MIKRILEDIKNIQKIAPNVEVYDNIIFFNIKGPKDSLYEKGVWKIRVELPKEYPYKSPSVGFITKIYHPNIDYNSGSICLNVLNNTWTPIYNICHIYETFLPQLLLYPNPEDPLNIKAANVYLTDINKYKTIVKKHIDEFCIK